MARFGKYTFVIYLLSALAALELIALAAVLAPLALACWMSIGEIRRCR